MATESTRQEKCEQDQAFELKSNGEAAGIVYACRQTIFPASIRVEETGNTKRVKSPKQLLRSDFHAAQAIRLLDHFDLRFNPFFHAFDMRNNTDQFAMRFQSFQRSHHQIE